MWRRRIVMSTTSGRERWILEVVRGRNVGRRYQVGTGETPIGNALAGAPGLDLADQESNSPRRMAGRHACLTVTGDVAHHPRPGEPRRHLCEPPAAARWPSAAAATRRPDSARRRAARGQARRPARSTDRGRRNRSSAPIRNRTRSPCPSRRSNHGLRPSPIPFTIPGGSTCKTWDDFLILAAQRWALVRDELTSGRLAEHLRRIGRTDLVPRPEPTQTADEQLDAWLARLPASRSSDTGAGRPSPELS